MSNSTLITIFVCLCVAGLIQADIAVNKCKGRRTAAADITYLNITGCTSYPCVLQKDTTPAITLGLKFNRRVNDLKLKIAGRIGGKEIPFNVDDSNHCSECIQGSPKGCILKKGSTYNYSYSLPILKEYPPLTLVVKYEVVDKQGNSVACFTFPAQIKE